MRPPSTRLVAAAILGVCAAGLAAALIAQHVYGFQPCPWCILQRLLMVAMGVAAVVMMLVPRPGTVARFAAALVAVGGACGMAAAIYQNRVASKSYSCDLSLADRVITVLHVDRWMPDVFEVRASCADAAVAILGIPFEIWSAAAFFVLAASAVWVALRGAR